MPALLLMVIPKSFSGGKYLRLITNWSFVLTPHQITAVDDCFGPLSQDFSLMSIFPHMHLLGKDLECYAITPMNDTINLIRINQWDFEWQGFYFFEKFIKIPAGSIIYAKGNYDNTVSLSNPNPTLVYPGDNTTDEMFVFGFQFCPSVWVSNISHFSKIYPTNLIDNRIFGEQQMTWQPL